MDTLLNADLQSAIYLFGYNLLIKTGISNQMAHAINSLLLLGLLFILLYVVDLFIRKLLRSIVIKIVRKSKTRFDDFLIQNKVLKYLTHLIPLIIAKQTLPLIFTGFPKWTNFTLKITDILIIITVTLLVKAIFYAVKDLLNTKKRFTSILSPEASVERHEYLKLEMNQEQFDKIKNQVTITNNGETIKKVFIKLTPSPEDTELINIVYLNYLVQNISENEILVTFKTEDNFFAGYQRVIEDGVELIKGVSYTDIYGEFVTASIQFIEVSDEDVNFKHLPSELGSETEVSPVILNAFEYKDGGERLAMSILIKSRLIFVV